MANPVTIRRQAADWTAERVRRFWDYLAASPRGQENYFSNMVGAGIAEFVRRAGHLHGRVLDYGCGPGYLLQHVFATDQRVECWGVDFSARSVEQSNARFTHEPRWRGAQLAQALPIAFESGFFDVVFCVETLEHLQDDDLGRVLCEIRRLLKPAGAVMFTVPFAENLAENMTYCPFCESEFHSVQHLRSFDVASLRALLAEHGFDVSFCDNVNLWTFQRPFPRRGQGVRGVLTNLADRSAVLLDRVDQRPFQRSAVFTRLATPGPHLCALASPRR